MLLKELQIRGFKSFLNNTIMRFPKGVTAIVGPNGSGKSNISDAIRWVLGESSVKSLRGNKMEDIIFTGTDSIKPVSFAEVSITFTDCKIKDLPYDEIVVTRRLFRDGNSEYLINKNKVRLRDIRELFMDTGIGRDGYSLIGQGQIDNVLSNKPEDRRDIFEEASGISLFKYKKDEAQRKIERSNDDLDRLSDIFGEINKQYDYLEVESEKTQKYNEVILEKNSLELDLLHYNMNKSIEDFKTIKKEKEILESDLSNIKNKDEESEREKEKINSQIDLIEKNIEEMNNEKMLKYREFSEIKSNHNILIERKQNIQNNLDTIVKNIEDNKTESIRLSEEIKGLEEDLKNSNNESDESFDDKIVSLRKDLKEVQENLDSLKEIENKNNILKAEYEADKKLKEEKHKFYLSEIKNVEADILKFEKNIEALEENLVKYKDENNSFKNDYDGLKNEAIKIKETHEKNVVAFEEVKNVLTSLNNRKSNLELNINFNANILESNELLYQPIKFLEKNYSEKDGYLGTVVSRIDTERDYVKAIETALGSRLQYVFSSKVNDAKRMINDLNSKKAGRATFLPLDTTNTSKIQSMKDAPQGVKGYAIEFIKAEEPYLSIISYLLKDIVIVDNLDTGTKYQKQFKMIVTMNGEQLNQYGSITGGISRNERETPLSIKAKIEELKSDLAQVQSEFNKNTDEYNSLASSIKNTNIKLSEIQNDENALKSKIIMSDNQVDLSLKEIEKLKNDYAEKTALRDSMIGLIESYNEDANNLTIEEVNPIKITQLNEKKKMLSEEIDKYELLRQDSIDNILKRNSLDFKIESNKNKIELINKEIADLYIRKETQEQSIMEIEAQIKGCIVKLADVEDLQKKDDEEILKIQNKKNELKNNIADIDRIIKLNQENASQISNKINQYELRETRIDESFENYKLILKDKGIEFEEFINSTRDAKNLRAKKDRIAEIDKVIAELGMVNLNAINEFKELSERREFYRLQISDIQKSISDLNSVVANINRDMKVQFKENMVKIRENFQIVFKKLFNGGEADLYLVDESDPLNSGINILAKPPGKKLQSLSLLSGGEKTLTAMALLFAILKLKPAPFCILDEIDAALDDINITRYTKFLKELAEDSQFLIITHRKTTLEVADTIYGVSMRDRGVSELISVRVEDYIEEVI